MCIAVVAIDPKIILLTQSCDCERLDNGTEGTPWMKEEATKGIQPNLTLEVQKIQLGSLSRAEYFPAFTTFRERYSKVTA